LVLVFLFPSIAILNHLFKNRNPSSSRKEEEEEEEEEERQQRVKRESERERKKKRERKRESFCARACVPAVPAALELRRAVVSEVVAAHCIGRSRVLTFKEKRKE
tara:strand:+ start:3728 stop:4042 length:315 start_codon:yes stop_codon:yes gene_type:complete